MKLVEVVSACAGLPDADTDTVVSDFRLAHAHICKYLSDKLGFWQRLPWKMVQAGQHHGRKEKAKRGGVIRVVTSMRTIDAQQMERAGQTTPGS